MAVSRVQLPSLRSLCLSGSSAASCAGFLQLSRAPLFARLESLWVDRDGVSGWGVGDGDGDGGSGGGGGGLDGVMHVFGGLTVPHLIQLVVHEPLGALPRLAGMRALASAQLPALRKLDLAKSCLNGRSLALLFRYGQLLSKLEELGLGCSISEEGGAAASAGGAEWVSLLAAAPLHQLRELSVSGSGFLPGLAEGLAAAAWVTGLESLWLHGRNADVGLPPDIDDHDGGRVGRHFEALARVPLRNPRCWVQLDYCDLTRPSITWLPRRGCGKFARACMRRTSLNRRWKLCS